MNGFRAAINWLSGGVHQYMPSSHCMNEDWLWIWIIIIQNIAIVVGYFIIGERWRKDEALANDVASKTALGSLRNIFLWCAICGYGLVAVRFQWPAWRLSALAQAPLIYFTYRYIFMSRGLTAVYARLGAVDRLEHDLSYYREIAETLPQIVWTSTVDGSIDYFNKRWYDYTGLHLDDKDWEQVTHPDDLKTTKYLWSEAHHTGGEYVNELRLLGKDGVYRWFLARGLPMKDDNGHVVRWLGTSTDIDTAKQEAERMRIEAEKRRFFMNALSHDLRSPLNAVCLNIEVTKAAIDMGDKEIASTSLETIQSNCDAAVGMLNSLLEFARFSTNDKNVLTWCKVSDIIRDVLRRSDRIAAEKGLYLVGDAPADVMVQTDKTKLERIVNNLVDNALKFTSKGGVTIETRILDDGVTLLVKDTGVGISVENQRLLFGEFFQAGNYERDRQKGFGIGLAAARVLSRQLGGDVNLVSSDSNGTTFSLKLGNRLKVSEPTCVDC